MLFLIYKSKHNKLKHSPYIHLTSIFKDKNVLNSAWTFWNITEQKLVTQFILAARLTTRQKLCLIV